MELLERSQTIPIVNDQIQSLGCNQWSTPVECHLEDMSRMVPLGRPRDPASKSQERGEKTGRLGRKRVPGRNS